MTTHLANIELALERLDQVIIIKAFEESDVSSDNEAGEEEVSFYHFHHFR